MVHTSIYDKIQNLHIYLPVLYYISNPLHNIWIIKTSYESANKTQHLIFINFIENKKR